MSEFRPDPADLLIAPLDAYTVPVAFGREREDGKTPVYVYGDGGLEWATLIGWLYPGVDTYGWKVLPGMPDRTLQQADFPTPEGATQALVGWWTT